MVVVLVLYEHHDSSECLNLLYILLRFRLHSRRSRVSEREEDACWSRLTLRLHGRRTEKSDYVYQQACTELCEIS